MHESAADGRERDLYLAVDLGASSGRVMLGGVAPGELTLEEVHRFQYPMRKRAGHLRWDFERILREVKTGLREAGVKAREARRRIRSVGVDTWGVDYGLLDAEGRLIEDPICYRDHRTDETMPEVFAQMPREEIFARTGIQFLVFNTIFQLFAHRKEGLAPQARTILMMADLLHHALCGKAAIEYSNASTTQLLDARTGDWDRELGDRLGLPMALLPAIVPAGADLGPVMPALATELALEDVRVVAPATHDTGSAVVGAPLLPGWAYISSGTWSLVGVERSTPLINAEVARENFTNEGGAYGTIRFLKNVMGLWLFESCKRRWEEQGQWVDYSSFFPQVAAVKDSPGLIYPDDQRLFNPDDMVAAIGAQMHDSGQAVVTDPVLITRVIMDSLALRYARVVEIMERLTGQPVAGIQIVGGGCQNGYLNQATANATGKPVLAGPVEATATGNLLVQAIAAGRFADLASARQHVRDTTSFERFEPRDQAAWQERRRAFLALEAKFGVR